MICDAEKFKEEDAKVAERVAAKNGLESYAYSLRNTVQYEKIASYIETRVKDKLIKEIDETIEWLDYNKEATKEEYESRRKELEGVANPIMTNMYQQAEEAPCDFPGAATGGS